MMRPPPREIRTLARIQGNTNLAHPPAQPTIDQGSHTHTPAAPVRAIEKPPKPPTTGELRLPVGESIVRRLVKPVGMALLLFALTAQAATTVITAPQGGKGACPFPACRGTTAVFDVTQAPYNALGNGTSTVTTALQAAATACETAGGGIIYAPPGTYLHAQVTIGSNCTLMGTRAAVFKCAATEPNACLHLSASGKQATNASNYGNPVSHAGVSGITINVNGTARIAASLGGYVRGLVVAHNSDHVTIDHVRIVDGGSRALEVNPSHNVWVTDNICENSSHTTGAEGDCLHVGNPCNNGIREPPGWCNTAAKIAACYDIHVNRNTVLRAGDTAYSGQYCSDEEFIGNHYFGDEYFACTTNADCGTGGTCGGGSICTPTSDESGFDFFGASRVRAVGNLVDKVNNSCVIAQAFTDPFGHVWAPTDILIDNLQCYRNLTTVTNSASVFLSGDASAPAYGMIVSNSTFRDSPVEAITYNTQILGGAILGNTGRNIGFNETASGDQAAVQLGAGAGSPVNGINVLGNRLECAAGSHCKWGIAELYTSAGQDLIANNTIVNVTQALIRATGAPIVLQSGNGITFASIGGGSNILDSAGKGSRIFCQDCTYNATTGLCNTGGVGAAGRWAEKRDAVASNWCCQSGMSQTAGTLLTTCG
jgi:Pectate lyase superfamily protein